MSTASTTDATATQTGGATRVARGEPVRAYPNWDPERRALILHSDRDAGSSYENVLVEADRTNPVANTGVAERGGALARPRRTSGGAKRRPRRRA